MVMSACWTPCPIMPTDSPNTTRQGLCNSVELEKLKHIETWTKQNGWQFGNHFQMDFLEWKFSLMRNIHKISLTCVSKCLNDNKSALVQVLSWSCQIILYLYPGQTSNFWSRIISQILTWFGSVGISHEILQTSVPKIRKNAFLRNLQQYLLMANELSWEFSVGGQAVAGTDNNWSHCAAA